MRNEKGVTLVSLVIYIAVMLIVLVVMNSIISNFYSNTEGMNTSVEELLNFNKFNIYFLKEIKLYDNTVDTINSEGESPYILFTSGNSFLFDSNKIYYNNLIICDNVKSINFECEEKLDEDNNTKYESIIKVTLSFENFTKTINYKLENIY